jgi:EmrB/QacA subfamily drug resistance transporter
MANKRRKDRYWFGDMTDNNLSDKHRQRWLIFTVAFAAFMTELDSSIVNVALPTISGYFDVSPSAVVWVIMAYLLIQTNTMLIFGKLGDIIGLKRLFITGYFIFVIGSFLCGVSMSITFLIVSRCIQGIGGAMLVTSGYAIVPRYLPKTIIGSAFGILGTAAALGVVIGAPIGGFITSFLSWHWIFLINVPFGIVAIFVANRVISEIRKEQESVRNELKNFDFLGSGLSFFGILSLVFALNMGQELGWASPSILLCLLTFVALSIFFVIWEKRSEQPLLDFGLFRNVRFACANIAAFMAFMVLDGTSFLLPFYLEMVKGLDPYRVGLVLMTFSLAYMLAGPIGGRLSDKIDPSYLCITTMVSASACVLMFAYTSQHQGLLFVFVFLIWFALSYGVFISATNNQVMRMAPEEQQGIYSGVFNTITNMGLVLGVCLFETVFSAALPERVSSKGESLARSDMSVQLLLTGFQNAFFLGGIILIVALGFSVMMRRNKQ